MAWGCESWALKEENRAKLESFHHSCLRRICGWTIASAMAHPQRQPGKVTVKSSNNNPCTRSRPRITVVVVVVVVGISRL
jgi:hypothetical protein